MPKFTVQLNITRTITVIADGEEEAIEAAWQIVGRLPGHDEGVSVDVQRAEESSWTTVEGGLTIVHDCGGGGDACFCGAD